jgi:hypothetical protein
VNLQGFELFWGNRRVWIEKAILDAWISRLDGRQHNKDPGIQGATQHHSCARQEESGNNNAKRTERRKE